MKRITGILLVMALLASMVACGDNKTGGDETSSQNNTTSDAETKSEYDYPALDCGGDKLTILNPENLWQMYTYLDHESMTGEIIDDAVYNRNRILEDKFNFKLEVIEYPIDDCYNQVQTTVTAGDDTYDAAYVRGNIVASAVSGGLTMNLYDISSLQLDKPWWNQSVVEEATVGTTNKALYFIMSDLSLCSFDLVWSIFFNESMMEDLGKEMPYDTVREGKWTIDTFNKMLKWGTNLNGDSSFVFSNDNSAIYGLTSFDRLCDAMIIGSGNRYVTKGADGVPALSLENDRFYNTAEKLANIFGTEGDFLYANDDQKKYDKIFKAGRALFYGGEVKSSGVFRDMDDSFGILPLPKYDENQDSYYGWMNFDTPTMIIPASCSNPERTGILLDALSYHSYKDVLPAYYNIRVSQKSLRNDDSIEMLGIIRDSLYYDASIAFGWTSKLAASLRDAIIKGDSNVASIIAANKDAVSENIAKTLENLE